MLTKQYTCDGCGFEDRPITIEYEPCTVPMPDEWAAHVIDGTQVHLCPDCNDHFMDFMHSFFECDQI